MSLDKATGHFKSERTVRSLAQQNVAWFLLIVVIAAIPAFLEGFDTELYFFGSPYILPTVHASAAFLGDIATGFALGIAIFSVVGGYLFDRFSVKYTVMLSVAVFTVFTVLTGYATTPTILFVARFLVGVGVGVFQPAIVALLGDIFFETRGRAVSAFAIFFGGGLFLGPLVDTPFLPHYSMPFLLSGIAAVLSLGAFQWIIPPTYKKWKRDQCGLVGYSTVTYGFYPDRFLCSAWRCLDILDITQNTCSKVWHFLQAQRLAFHPWEA